MVGAGKDMTRTSTEVEKPWYATTTWEVPGRERNQIPSVYGENHGIGRHPLSPLTIGHILMDVPSDLRARTVSLPVEAAMRAFGPLIWTKRP